MTDAAIVVQGLAKRFGDRSALNGVDLEIPTGSFSALLGPNGAGKTTVFRCLMGLIRSDAGGGHVLGEQIGPKYPSLALKARVGYVPQQPVLYERMTLRELVGMCRGLHPRWDDRTIKRYTELFGLPGALPVRQMSSGMRAQVALTLVMGGQPDLLLLDEPTQGLDPLNRHQYLQVLLADCMEAGRTVVISSHDLYQIERLADRATILKQGTVAVSGGLDELKDTEKRVRVAGEVSESELLAIRGVRRADRELGGWLLAVHGDSEAARSDLAKMPGVSGVQVFNQSLEEIFMSYVI